MGGSGGGRGPHLATSAMQAWLLEPLAPRRPASCRAIGLDVRSGIGNPGRPAAGVRYLDRDLKIARSSLPLLEDSEAAGAWRSKRARQLLRLPTARSGVQSLPGWSLDLPQPPPAGDGQLSGASTAARPLVLPDRPAGRLIQGLLGLPSTSRARLLSI